MHSVLLISMLFLGQLWASPLTQMKQRLVTYQTQAAEQNCSDSELNNDQGLFVDVSCTLVCGNSQEKVERLSGSFIPAQLGLHPGNGSNDEQVLWSAVGSGLKVWAQALCLERASETCQGIEKVLKVEVSELTSGNWNQVGFPGCQEKKITISPFGNDVRSKRINTSVEKLLASSSARMMENKEMKINILGLKVSIPLAQEFSANCQSKIIGKLCYGDCVDLTSTEVKLTETLATPTPLGQDEFTFCGDELGGALSSKVLSRDVRQNLCEEYFWFSLFQSNVSVKSCAALRGNVTCEGF